MAYFLLFFFKKKKHNELNKIFLQLIFLSFYWLDFDKFFLWKIKQKKNIVIKIQFTVIIFKTPQILKIYRISKSYSSLLI